MESVCGESNGWGYRSSYQSLSRGYSSESVSGESVTDIVSRYPNTPRIQQLKKELADLKKELIQAEKQAVIRRQEEEAERGLLAEINQVKEKIKKFPK